MKFSIPLLFLLFMGFRVDYYLNTQHQEYTHHHTIEKMTVDWEREGGLIHFSLKAPTKGWLAIGFNDRNAIVNADLKMFRIVNDQPEAQDFYVVSHGNPQKDEGLGGKSTMSRLRGKEDKQFSTVSFTIDITSSHYTDGNFDFSQSLWLIAAYSISDDFVHHSIMRKHIQVDFSK